MRPELQTAQSERELRLASDAAKQRLLDALGRLDTRTKAWARGAGKVTLLTGVALAGAATLWAGVALLKRRRTRARERALASTALVRMDPVHGDYLLVNVRRSVQLVTGLLGSLVWAWRAPRSPGTRRRRSNVLRLRASHRAPSRHVHSHTREMEVR